MYKKQCKELLQEKAILSRVWYIYKFWIIKFVMNQQGKSVVNEYDLRKKKLENEIFHLEK